jgi:hypothetical protein
MKEVVDLECPLKLPSWYVRYGSTILAMMARTALRCRGVADSAAGHVRGTGVGEMELT